MKRTLICTIFSLIFVLVTSIYWFYPKDLLSTASNASAFLNTTFGMSLPEVQKVIKKSGVQLVDREQFKVLDPEVSKKLLFFDQFELVFAEDKLKRDEINSWYMPSIEMFKSQVSAKYTFEKNKLITLYIVIIPLEKNNTANIVALISDKLNDAYQSVKKEMSENVSGAYNLKFKRKSSSADLWVNLTKKDNPIINLYITGGNAIVNQRDVIVKTREAAAF